MQKCGMWIALWKRSNKIRYISVNVSMFAHSPAKNTPGAPRPASSDLETRLNKVINQLAYLMFGFDKTTVKVNK